MQKRFDLGGGHAEDFHSLGPASITGQNSNSRLRPFQNLGQEFAQRFVGAVFDGRGLQSNLQGAVHQACDFVLAGSGLHAHCERNAASFRMRF